MKTFLSIVSINTNSFSDEKIVLGLIAVTANKVHYAYSKNKISLLNKFSHQNDLAAFVKSILGQINHSVVSANAKLNSPQQSLVKEMELFTVDYFTYLNNYNNGVVQFSEPVTLNYNFVQKDFSSYYQNFVGEELEVDKPTPKTTFSQKLKPLFQKEYLAEKADLNYPLYPAKFKGLLKETHLPLITKNGSIAILQTIDFDNQVNTITNHLYETKIIHNALTVFANTKGEQIDKIKIGFEEPELNTDQHSLFDMALKEYQEIFEFATLDKVNDFTEKVALSDNTKFSELF